jgi:hypothetical protein
LVKIHVDESFVVVATTATLVPPAGDSNNRDSSPKADINAFVIPAGLYLLSVVKDITTSRHLRANFDDAKGRAKQPLFLNAVVERATN